MKLLYELEDSVVGIIVGLLIFVYAKIIPVTIPYFNIIFPVVVGIFLVLNLLDVIYFVKDLHQNIVLSLVSLVTNLVDIVINLGILSILLNFRLPFIQDTVVPLFRQQGIFAAGAYLIIINVVWIVWYHKGE